MLFVTVTDATGKKVCPDVAFPEHEFKTGSKGRYANDKVSLVVGTGDNTKVKRFQCQYQWVEIGSKPGSDKE